MLDRLLQLAANKDAASQVRAVALLKLKDLKDWLEKSATSAKDVNQKAQYLFAVSQIQQFEASPETVIITPPSKEPDGAPIGSFDEFSCEW